MRITASALRQNVYRILDEAIETGAPVEIVRKGVVVRLVPEKKPSIFSRLKKRDTFVGDPDDIIGMDWSKEWSELKSPTSTRTLWSGSAPGKSKRSGRKRAA